jgi:transposase
MAYREVTMVEVKEVLRLWLGEMGKRRIAAQLGLDPKTVRGYIEAARTLGLERPAGEAGLTDELVGQVVAARQGKAHRPHGDTWSRCGEHREFIERHLRARVRLSKIRKLLRRQGVQIPYATLRRWAVVTLGFGRTAPTLPVVDGKPGEECQLDTGWVLTLEADAGGKRRRLRAWIFTAVVSRHRFVYPIERETTASAIAACEAAWEFFGGIFRVLLADNTKAIVQRADPLEPLINGVFLEYAQARGFYIDTARVRRPKDKARVERSVPTVREHGSGAWRTTGSTATPPRSACRASTSRAKNGTSYCRRPRPRTISRCRPSRRWPAISTPRWPRHCTRCPPSSLASGCLRAPTAAPCASITAACS